MAYHKTRMHIFGHLITIFTYYGALAWLIIRRPALKGKPYGWSMLLSSYQLKIVYVKGSTNLDAGLFNQHPFAGDIEPLLKFKIEKYLSGKTGSYLFLEDPLIFELARQICQN